MNDLALGDSDGSRPPEESVLEVGRTTARSSYAGVGVPVDVRLNMTPENTPAATMMTTDHHAGATMPKALVGSEEHIR